MARIRRTIFSIGFVIGVTIAVLVAAGALITITHSNSAARQQRLVVSNFETISLMREALLAMEDAEGSQRGFLLSGDVASLEPYERARLRIDTLLRQLEVSAGEGEAGRQMCGQQPESNGIGRIGAGQDTGPDPGQRHQRGRRQQQPGLPSP